MKEETLAQVEQYTDIMADTEVAYAAEVASIPARQQEYADIIKANEDKKTQLLRNTRVMMNLDPKMRVDIEAAFSNFEQPDFSRDVIPESGDD